MTKKSVTITIRVNAVVDEPATTNSPSTGSQDFVAGANEVTMSESAASFADSDLTRDTIRSVSAGTRLAAAAVATVAITSAAAAAAKATCMPASAGASVAAVLLAAGYFVVLEPCSESVTVHVPAESADSPLELNNARFKKDLEKFRDLKEEMALNWRWSGTRICL